MSDDPNKRGWQDRDRINRHEAYEVDYVAEKFGVSRQTVIDKVGNMRTAVYAELRRITGRS